MTVPSSSVVVTSGQEGTSGLPGRLGDGWGWEREGVLLRHQLVCLIQHQMVWWFRHYARATVAREVTQVCLCFDSSHDVSRGLRFYWIDVSPLCAHLRLEFGVFFFFFFFFVVFCLQLSHCRLSGSLSSLSWMSRFLAFFCFCFLLLFFASSCLTADYLGHFQVCPECRVLWCSESGPRRHPRRSYLPFLLTVSRSSPLCRNIIWSLLMSSSSPASETIDSTPLACRWMPFADLFSPSWVYASMTFERGETWDNAVMNNGWSGCVERRNLLLVTRWVTRGRVHD